MPMVIRIPRRRHRSGRAPQREPGGAVRAHPGLKVVACSNPVDGYWMIQQAIARDDPVIFLEPKRQYHADKAELDESGDARPALHVLASSAAARTRPDPPTARW